MLANVHKYTCNQMFIFLFPKIKKKIEATYMALNRT